MYSLWLTGDVMAPGWSMSMKHDALVEVLRRLSGRLVLVVCEAGLSIRSRGARVDVPGMGFWASPLSVPASRLRRALKCNYGDAHLEFVEGWLWVNASSMEAREL